MKSSLIYEGPLKTLLAVYAFRLKQHLGPCIHNGNLVVRRLIFLPLSWSHTVKATIKGEHEGTCGTSTQQSIQTCVGERFRSQRLPIPSACVHDLLYIQRFIFSAALGPEILAEADSFIKILRNCFLFRVSSVNLNHIKFSKQPHYCFVLNIAPFYFAINLLINQFNYVYLIMLNYYY